MSDQQRQRLRDLTVLLRDNTLTTVEIAERFDISRQAALKDIKRLREDGIPVIEVGDTPHYTIDRSYFKQLNLSLAQAWFLYLPLRRIVRAAQNRFPLARHLLHEIAAIVHPEIALHLAPEYERTDIADDSTFTTLVEAWEKQCHVEVYYRRLNADQETRLIFAPWWFEPAVWSDAFYVIGGMLKSNGEYEQLTLKLNRVRWAKLLKDDHFERPSSVTLLNGITKTWGIWLGEGDAVRVVLRFHNRQLDRLKESRWHPSEKLSIAHDGSIIWEGEVSEPQEMMPWILGWGADVEVVEPQHIRQQVIDDVLDMMRIYGLSHYEEDEDDIF